MKLIAAKIKNFRAYREETKIEIDNLTALIGKNDIGKSSVLEALEIFFNNKSPKLENIDLNVFAANDGESEVEISCIFSEFTGQIIIDSSNPTTLEKEHLLNTEGYLEIKKKFNCGTSTAPKEKVFVVAHHPTNEFGNDLLLLKQADLKKRATTLQVQSEYNSTLNSEIRNAIWGHLAPLSKSTVEIQVDKEDMKRLWENLEPLLPQYALFRSDRESNDGDKEVTDPMKLAVDTALRQMQSELDVIQEKVREKAIEVANNTLEKLSEMNPDIANHLIPDFKSDPKWSGIFNLTLSSDNNIPVNKRGSGVRRLIILNFFRAEAERKRKESNSQSIIYAFEEPENSQHPDHQRMLINAFIELSENENTQVLITTHNSALAGLIPENSLRLIKKDIHTSGVIISDHTVGDDIINEIAITLGMLPNPLLPKIIVCVEGPNDVIFIKTLNKIVRKKNTDIIDLDDPKVAFVIPLGGGTLKQWVDNNYLKQLGLPEFHLYDRDDENPPKYQAARDDIRRRWGADGSWAELTNKREIENYIHPSCINSFFSLSLSFNPMDDIPALIAKERHNNADTNNNWDELKDEKRKKKEGNVKRNLVYDVLPQMTYELLLEIDPDKEVESWFVKIGETISLRA